MRGSPSFEGKAAWTLAQRCSSSAQYPRRRLANSCTGESSLTVRVSRSAKRERTAHSLQDALYEPALEYYTNHSKRVRRKRNRHSQASSYQVPISPLATAGTARPLRPEGWTVRYEYKMACFAEFRGEDQVALKYVWLPCSSIHIFNCICTDIIKTRTRRSS